MKRYPTIHSCVCRKEKTVFTFAGLLAGTCLFPTQPPPHVPKDFVADTAIARRLDSYLSRLVPFGYSGSALVAREGQVILNKGYGLADDATHTLNRSETVQSIGSVTKQFTAAAIMKLEQMGKLSTQDPLTKFFAGVPADKRGITLHHLLTHTAGAIDYTGDDYEKAERDATVRKVLDAPLLFAPGANYTYSNAGYSVLAAVVEIVSGQPYETFVQEHLLAPAGMRWTGYRLPDWRRVTLAHAYANGRDNKTNPELEYPTWNVMGNGEILSTTGDLYRWHLALTGDAILNAAEKAKLYTPARNNYAYGWDVEETKHGKRIEHNGGSDTGTSCVFRRYVDANVVLVLFANRDTGKLGPITDRIDALAFGEDVPLPPEVDASGRQDLRAFTGDYTVESGAVLQVRAAGAGLRLTPQSLKASEALLGGANSALLNDIVRRSEACLEYILSGDMAAFSREISDPEKLKRFHAFLDNHRKEAEAEMGKPQRVEAVSVLPAGRDFADYRVNVRIVMERGAAVVSLYWKGTKLAAMGGGDLSLVKPTLSLYPARDGTFAGYSIVSGTTMRVRFEDGGRNLTVLSDQPVTFRKQRTFAASFLIHSAGGAETTTLSAKQRIPELQRYSRAMEALGYKGILLAAQHGQVVCCEGIGGIQRDASFNIASIAKSITAVALLRLVERGQLALDAPLSRFFPDVPADKAPITVQQLLRHTGGIGNPTGDTAEGVTDRRKAVQMILATPLVAVPGKEFNYSNDGYTLLAAILEVVCHGSWESVIRREILVPAGMQHTYFVGDMPPPGAPLAPTSTSAHVAASWGSKGGAGILSTAEDMARFQFALTGGKLLTPKILQSMSPPIGSKLFAQGDVFTLWPGEDDGPIWIHGGADSNWDHYSKFAYFVNQDALLVTFGFGDEALATAFATGALRVLFGAPAPVLRVTHLSGTKEPSAPMRFMRGDSVFLIRPEEGGRLMLFPEGQAAVALLACRTAQQKQAADQTDRHAATLLHAIADGKRPQDDSPVVQSLVHFLEGLAGRQGKLLRIEVMGTAPNWTDPSQTYLTFARAVSERGQTIFRLYWKGDRLLARGGSVYPNPAPTPLIPKGDGSYIGWNPSIGVLSDIRISPDGLAIKVQGAEMKATRRPGPAPSL